MEIFVCNKCSYCGPNSTHKQPFKDNSMCNYVGVLVDPKTDPIVNAVCADLKRRSTVGINKYGTTLAENPGDLLYWLQHAYEETLDKANYLKAAITELQRTMNDGK